LANLQNLKIMESIEIQLLFQMLVHQNVVFSLSIPVLDMKKTLVEI